MNYPPTTMINAIPVVRSIVYRTPDTSFTQINAAIITLGRWNHIATNGSIKQWKTTFYKGFVEKVTSGDNAIIYKASYKKDINDNIHEVIANISEADHILTSTYQLISPVSFSRYSNLHQLGSSVTYYKRRYQLRIPKRY